MKKNKKICIDIIRHMDRNSQKIHQFDQCTIVHVDSSFLSKKLFITQSAITDNSIIVLVRSNSSRLLISALQNE